MATVVCTTAYTTELAAVGHDYRFNYHSFACAASLALFYAHTVWLCLCSDKAEQHRMARNAPSPRQEF